MTAPDDMCFQNDVAACPYANNAEYVSGINPNSTRRNNVTQKYFLTVYLGISAFLGLGKKQGIKNVEIRFTM